MEVVVVDDRPEPGPLLRGRSTVALLAAGAARLGHGPGGRPQRRLAGDDGGVGRLPRRRRRAARRAGARDLAADLAACAPTSPASQGRIRVPLPPRPPADRLGARDRRACERARWATADMAYRRAALAAVGGFDERFPRAYREDADLALRVSDARAGACAAGGARIDRTRSGRPTAGSACACSAATPTTP